MKFNSLTSCVEYLNQLGFTIKRDTLTKYIQDEKVFQNFLCKYSEISLPEDFKQVGLIIDEYKKLNKDSTSFQEGATLVNKKNKGVLVNNGAFSKEFESIMDTVRYFENINIKLGACRLRRKILNSRLKGSFRSPGPGPSPDPGPGPGPKDLDLDLD